ncbi:MAG: photosynthetic complex putative assembly protein PuhB [Pseudomonadota bacterium]
MSHHDDFAGEPIPGLPAHLPEGEEIKWQGRPDPAALARRVLHRNKVAIYFALLAAWRVLAGVYDGLSAGLIAGQVLWALCLGAAALIILTVIAGAMARTTVYTVTNKRVVMRIGVALPVTFNFPFSQITSADLARTDKSSGTVALSLSEHSKVSWAVLWPHARPWKLRHPQPAIRAVADIDTVAGHIIDGLRAHHGADSAAMTTSGANAETQTTTPERGQPTAQPIGALQTKGA